MTIAVYLNGVFEGVLEEIRKAQSQVHGLVCYLQPYSSGLIVKLAKSPPSPDEPIDLYLSTTTLLPFVSYRAKLVGWEDKSKLSRARLKVLNAHIKSFQPHEKEIYKIGGRNKPSNNLLSVIQMEKLETPLPLSCFIKLSNQTPLKPRRTSGGWSYVRPAPEWIGSVKDVAFASEVQRDFDVAVKNSIAQTEEERAERLKNAAKLPKEVLTISRSFIRNPVVAASVLHRADGKCELCHEDAPFLRAKDGTPYLEVHHRITLANHGEDTVENAMALCPNCHRMLHYGTGGTDL